MGNSSALLNQILTPVPATEIVGGLKVGLVTEYRMSLIDNHFSNSTPLE